MANTTREAMREVARALWREMPKWHDEAEAVESIGYALRDALASERQAREEAERERDEQAQARMDGIALHRAENTANAKRLAAQQETIRSRMEALVRMRISQYPGEVGLRWLLSDLRAEAALKEQG